LLFLLITSLSPAGNASGKTDTMKEYFDFHKTSKKTGVAGQVQKIVGACTRSLKKTKQLAGAFPFFMDFKILVS
jgi:hypothetical protein